jgi:catechol 2,3-dioxygenase-like lactoylglutathione lyase family enzyme
MVIRGPMKLLGVTLRVPDQQDSLRFLTEELGFVKRADYPYGQGQRWITVSPPDEDAAQIVLQPPEWFTGARREQHLQYVGHNPTLVFPVEDCNATNEQLQRSGVRFTLLPSQRAYGIEADATDIDGNTLLFLQLMNAKNG